ncbi:MAG: hypothetical protein ACI4F1_08300 [Bariatricus sp.]
MKLEFEKPVMSVELFAANQAVSTCTVEGGISYDFDCMYGPEVDTKNVISNQIPEVTANCSLAIAYAGGISTARDYSSGGSHSNNSSRASWTKERDYLQVSYSGAQGLLYTDGDLNTDSSVWTVEDGYVKHAKKRGGTHHMVAPVIDSRTINASW